MSYPDVPNTANTNATHACAITANTVLYYDLCAEHQKPEHWPGALEVKPVKVLGPRNDRNCVLCFWRDHPEER